MKLKTLLLLALSLSCLHFICGAQTSSDSVKVKRRREFIPLPILYFSPETRAAVGSLGIFLFKTGGNARTSTIDFAALYTQNKQIIVDPIYSVFTKGEKYYIKGNVLFTKYPEFFYGVGDETANSAKTKVAYKTFRIYNRILRKVAPHVFVGFQQQYYNTFDVDFSKKIIGKDVPGNKGSVTSGIGPSLLYDTRDNIFNPSKGVYAEFSSIVYNRVFGGEYVFGNYILDVRKYKTINPNTILALQGFMNLNFGDTPFKQMCTVGGPSIMRGYYNGRYRDKKLIAFQAEWRQHLYRCIGYTLFADIGDVMPTLKAFDIDALKPTAGGGLRFLISKTERLNARIDAGFGKNTHGIYINIAEAF